MNENKQEIIEQEEVIVYEITTETGEVLSYNKIMAAIDILDKETEDLTIIEDDNKSYDFAKSKRLVYKKLRTTVENRRKDLNKDAQKIISARNAAASKIKDKIEPGESRLKALEVAEDNRRAKKEQARVDTIHNRVKLIQAATQGVASMRSERITELIQGVRDVEITEADYQEMMPQAESAKIIALEELGKALADALSREAVEIKRVAEEKALKEKNEALEKKLKEERLAREVQEKELAEKDAALKAEQDKKDEKAATEKAELEAKVKAMEDEKAENERKAEEERLARLAKAENEIEDELNEIAADIIVDGLNEMEDPEPEPQKEFGATTLEQMDEMNGISMPETPKEKMVFPDFTEELRFLVDESEKASEFTTDQEEREFFEFVHEAMATALTEIELFQPEPEEEDMHKEDMRNAGPGRI
jgi:hypothetical protein